MKRILLIALLTACGTDPNAEPTATPTPAAEGGINYQPTEPEQKELVVEYRKDGDTYAITVADTSALPACSRANSQQLAWVKTTEQFFSCEDETWTEIKMQKPADGAIGAVGPKGDKGDPGTPVTANQWFDPITEDRWLIGASIRSDTLANVNPCSNGWALASSSELQAAVTHGLSVASVAIGGPAIFWSADFIVDTDTFSKRVYVKANGTAEVFTTGAGPAGVACLATPEA